MQGSRDPEVCAAPGSATRIVLAVLHLGLGTTHGSGRGGGLGKRVGEVSSVLVAGILSAQHLEEGLFRK